MKGKTKIISLLPMLISVIFLALSFNSAAISAAAGSITDHTSMHKFFTPNEPVSAPTVSNILTKGAAIGTVSNIKATQRTTTQLKLTWSSTKNATGYRIFIYSTNVHSWEKLATVVGTDYTVKGLAAGTIYKFRVKAFSRNNGGLTWGEASPTLKTATNPAVPNLFKSTKGTESSVTLTWKETSGASGYRIFVYNSRTKAWKKIKTLSDTSYTMKKLTAGTTYKFRIKSFKRVDGKLFWSDATPTLTTSTRPATPQSFSSCASTKSSVTLAWKKTSGASGYRIFIYNSKTKAWEKEKTVTDTSCTVKNLAAGTTYKFRIKAFRRVDGKLFWSDSTATLKVKTAAPLSTPEITKVDIKYEELTLNWGKISQADGYIVYRKNLDEEDPEFYEGYILLGKTKNTFFIDRNIAPINEFATESLGNASAVRYSYYIKAYNNSNKSTVYSNASTPKTISRLGGFKNTDYMDIEGKFINESTFMLSWKNLYKGVDGYEIVYGNDVHFYEKNIKKIYVKGENSTSVKIENLDKDMIHYIQVRPCKKIGIVNYLTESAFLSIEYDNEFNSNYNDMYLNRYYTYNIYNTCVDDIYGCSTIVNSLNLGNPTEYDYNLYCHICDKKGCSVVAAPFGNAFNHFCFICNKQIYPFDCHPTSHVVYSENFVTEHNYEYCSICGQLDCNITLSGYYCVICEKYISGMVCHPESHFLASFE